MKIEQDQGRAHEGRASRGVVCAALLILSLAYPLSSAHADESERVAGGRGREAEKREASHRRAPEARASAAVEAGQARRVVVDPIDVRARGQRQRGPGDLVGEEAEASAAERALDDPAFVTVVRIDERAGETSSIAEVLARTMGVRVRSLGGLGGFSSLSVRGASSGHTAVLIDGVPLSRIASVTADLGRFQLTSFSELELYRGGVPVEYGGAALGGALNMVTRVGDASATEHWKLAAGVGSFGARHLRGRWTGTSADGRRGVVVAAGYAGADGDFVYFDDNGTNLNPSDDEYTRRTNNAFDQVDGVVRYRALLGDYTVVAGGRSLWKQQGIPGSASVQSENASLGTFSQLADVRVDKPQAFGLESAVGTASAYALVERQRYRDLDNEIGLAPQDRRYLSASGGLRTRLSVAVGASQVISSGLEGTADYFAESDLLVPVEEDRNAAGLRLGFGATLSDELLLGGDDRIVLAPGVRVDVLHTDPIADRNSVVTGPVDASPRTEMHPSPRVSFRGRVVDGLVTKGSAGFYFRAPTLTELYGDRGFVVGNPGLAAETGVSADLGMVFAPAYRLQSLGLDRLYLESAAFAVRPRDVIALVPTAGLATVAQNLGDADIYGLEIGASLRLARTATLTGNYTALRTRQRSEQLSYDGKALPQRPTHQLYARLDVAQRLYRRLAILWGDYTFASQNYLDPGNVSEVPARHLVGAGVKLEIVSRLLVGFEVKNLTNERVEYIELSPPPRPDLTRAPRAVADFFGYPLPGRSFYLGVEWTF